MTRTLVAYASKHGSTEEVARAIGSFLRDADHHVDVRDVEAVTDVEPYDAVVLGASLYMGRVHAGARTFLRNHHAALEERSLAVFALGPLTLEKEQVAGSRKQLDKALEHLGVDPQLVTVFGGVVDPKQLHFPLNRMPKTDARDWSAIEAWAGDVALRFSTRVRAEPV
jgi:menaquinone-dependent protoporphyrinogen oxidase